MIILIEKVYNVFLISSSELAAIALNSLHFFLLFATMILSNFRRRENDV